MKPTIGRIVIYIPTENGKEKMKEAQDSFIGQNVSEQCPAIITAVHSDTCVNLKVITDGELLIWKSSSLKGDQPGNWNWPVKE